MIWNHFDDPLFNSGMKQRIHKEGIVEYVEGNRIGVRLSTSSSCEGCKMHGSCQAIRCEGMLVTEESCDAARFHVGDKVRDGLALERAVYSLGLAFGLPMAILLCVVVLVFWATAHEALAALTGIAALLPYYICVYCLRRKVSKWVAMEIA